VARMYPDTPPAFDSSAERRLFHAFQEQLPDDYIVMHSVPWMDPDTKTHHHEGEIDFLIIHPRIGIILMEVKGGRIEIRDGEWYSIDRYDVAHHLKRSPVQQIQRSMRSIQNRLRNTATTRIHASDYRIQTCVAFPDISTRDLVLGPDTPPEMVFDDRDVFAVEAALQRIAGVQSKDRQLSSKAIRALEALLKPDVRVEDYGYAARLDRSAREIEALTDQQYEILQSLQHHNQLAIAGCAGSGKTMLALKRAKFLAQSGQHVLLTCYNRPLAEWLAEVVASDPAFPDEFIRVQNFDRLAQELLSDTPGGAPAIPRQGDRNDHFSVTLPTALSEALENGAIETRFDAIIVDEGQDFTDFRWLCLQQLLVDPEDGIFYVFFDSEQGIYEQEDNIPVRISDIVLTRNCRNTAPIHDTLLGYYPGDVLPLSSNIDGPAPDIIPVTAADYPGALREAFDRIFNQEGIPTSQAVVLTFSAQRKSALEDGQRIGKFLLTWDQPEHPNQVMVSTVHSFKGLERPIVFLVLETDRYREDLLRPSLYVGISRAKQHLIVIGTLPEPIERERPLDPWLETEDVGIDQPITEKDPDPVPEPGEDVEIIEPVSPEPEEDPDPWLNTKPEPAIEDLIVEEPHVDDPHTPEPEPEPAPVNDVDVEIIAPKTPDPEVEQPSAASTVNPAPAEPSQTPSEAGIHPSRAITLPPSRNAVPLDRWAAPEARRAPAQWAQPGGGSPPVPAARPHSQAGRVLPGSDGERILAALGYLVWFIVPVGLLLISGKSLFARRNAWQAIIFGMAGSAYLLGFGIFWLILLDIQPLLACMAIFGGFLPLVLGLYYAARVYTRSQSHFLILSDLTRTLIRNL
jgi:hypothetical protein